LLDNHKGNIDFVCTRNIFDKVLYHVDWSWLCYNIEHKLL